jgi:hypothetical protein
MKTIKNEGLITTSFCLPEETLEQVRETARRVGVNPSTFYLVAIAAMLKRFEGGAVL